MKNRWHALLLGALATALQGQELYVQTLTFTPGRWDEAHGVAVNPAGEALVVGKMGQGWPLAVLASPQGEPQWTLVLDGTGSLQRALPVADGWAVAGAVDFWPYDYGGAFVAKLDGAGNLLWQAGLTGGNEPARLAPAPGEGYYVGFNRRYDFLLEGPGVARVNASGELMWVRVLAMPFLQLTELCSAPDGSLLVVATASEGDGHYGVVSSWDSQGEPLWSFRLPRGTTLDACSFGPTGRWLLAGKLESPGKPPALWVATLHPEGRFETQKKLVSDEGLWGHAATAGSGWLVAVSQALAYGEAVMLQRSWDLSQVSGLAYHGGRGVFPAGVAPFPNGTVLLVGTDMTGVTSQLFMVKSFGRLEDFWGCWGLLEPVFGLEMAQEQLEPFAPVFSRKELYPLHWAVTRQGGDLPQREVRCVGASTPAADLVLQGQASFDEELGAHAVVVVLRVTNQGEVAAPERKMDVSAGHGGTVQGLPVGFSCQWLQDMSRALCQLGTMSPGAEVALAFVVRGSIRGLRQGEASVSTTAPERTYGNNRVAFDSIIPPSPQRVLKPRPSAPPVLP